MRRLGSLVPNWAVLERSKTAPSSMFSGTDWKIVSGVGAGFTGTSAGFIGAGAELTGAGAGLTGTADGMTGLKGAAELTAWEEERGLEP